MERERAIIHLNVADFAVTVEQALERTLRGRPLMIAEPGAGRARVFDMSEEAYRMGIRKGMRITHAQSLSREVRILPLRLDRYARAAQALVQRARPYSPQIEQPDGNGHLYVDVTGMGKLWGSPPEIAWRLRKAIRAEMDLDPIWAVAPNKLVAKVATRLVKPVGEYIVEAGEEPAFLQAVPLQLLPGLPPATLARLQELHLWKAGEVARMTLGQLTVAVGAAARRVYAAVRGIDSDPVLPVDVAQAEVTAEHEFAEDTTDRERIEAALYRLADRTGTELRARGRSARRLVLQLSYADGVNLQRQTTVAAGENNTDRLHALAARLLAQAWQRRIRVRHLQLTLAQLIEPPTQGELFPTAERANRRATELMRAIDRIRERFGQDAIANGQSWALPTDTGAGV